jgi:hypothetical protein
MMKDGIAFKYQITCITRVTELSTIITDNVLMVKYLENK